MGVPARIDGVSLLPTLSGIGKQRKSTIYFEFNNQQGLYLDGYKGIRMKATSHEVDFEIFNTVIDGPESKNLAGNSDIFNRLQKRMKDEVLRIRMPNRHAKKPYDDELVPGIDIDKNKLKNGVGANLYKGTWEWVPEFSQLSANNSLLGKDLSITNIPIKKNNGVLFSGHLLVPHSGAWTFHCKSTGQFIFKIHKKLVLDADYKYSGEEISRTMNLSKGIHPYRMYYKDSSPKPNISLQWESEKVAKSVIPANALFVEKPQS